MDITAGFFSIFIKLLALLTPPAVLSAFLGGTATYSRAQKHKTAIRTGMAVFVIGTILYFCGDVIFSIFGFTLDAFRIGSGALLFLTAVNLMEDPHKQPIAEDQDDDISIVPLAIPICMGPASIGTLMVMGASTGDTAQRLVGAGALLLASLIITVMLLLADHVQRILGKTGLAALAKLTGLLMAAIAAQVVFTGIKNFLQ